MEQQETTPGNSGAPAIMSLSGQFDDSAFMDMVATAEEGTWITVPGNFNDVWPDLDELPARVTTPKAIIAAWGAMAWNPNAGQILITGGGHANYSGNDVYAWSIATLSWSRLSLPTKTYHVDDSPIEPFRHYETVDGPAHSPIGAHLYDGLIYLPLADRMVSFGGATYNLAGNYIIADVDDNGETVYRPTGPYFFDPNVADGDKVGGLTGSGVQSGVEGTQAWENRDSIQKLFDLGFSGESIGTSTAYLIEDGKEVIFFKPYRYSAHELWKYTIVDPNNPALDTFEKVGKAWAGASNPGAGTYDPTRNIYVQADSRSMIYWDLSTGQPERSQFVKAELPDGSNFWDHIPWGPGFDYDPIRDRYLMWGGDGIIYSMTAPDNLRDPWPVEVMTPDAAFDVLDVPDNDPRNVHGKWQYIPQYDVFLGLLDAINGDISIYKPTDWSPPDGGVIAGTDIVGTNGPDDLSGFGGNDMLDALAGRDTLDGGSGDDRLLGRQGDDELIGGEGADTLNGGSGIDTADYSTSPDAVQINLASQSTAQQAGGDAAGDLVIAVESVIGSAFNDTLLGRNMAGERLDGGSGDDMLDGRAGDDTLIGGLDDDWIMGREDDDILVGGAGADTLNGGGGNDTADYSDSPEAIDIDLSRANGTAQKGGEAEGDIVLSVEVVIGSAFDDRVIGRGVAAERLSGLGGNDEIGGRGGTDTLIGGLGNDTLTGGGGADLFVLAVGAGTDTITDFEKGTDQLGLLNGLTFADLSVSANGSNALVTATATSELLAVVRNAAGLIDQTDFLDDFMLA